jgi:magnesium transporter
MWYYDPFARHMDISGEWSSLVGIIIAICGNVLVSIALNIQRYVHTKLQKGRYKIIVDYNGDQTPIAGDISTNYLKYPLWWVGISLMSLGELGNFLAYGFAPASVVAPLGTVAILSNALLAPLMLHEHLRKSDMVGILIAVVGAAAIVLSSSETEEPKVSPRGLFLSI